MKYQDMKYQDMALRTESIVEGADRQKMRLLHAAIGIGTEVAELMAGWNQRKGIVNIVEEIGDIQWYLAVLCDVMGWRLEDIVQEILSESRQGRTQKMIDSFWTPEKAMQGMVIEAGTILDVAKRHVFYGLEPGRSGAAGAVSSIVCKCIEFTIWWHTDIETVQAKNILKLMRRYPGKFDSGNAENRDTTAEITAMQDSDAVKRLCELWSRKA